MLKLSQLNAQKSTKFFLFVYSIFFRQRGVKCSLYYNTREKIQSQMQLLSKYKLNYCIKINFGVKYSQGLFRLG